MDKTHVLLKLTSAMVAELMRDNLLDWRLIQGNRVYYFLGYETAVDDNVIDWQFVKKEAT